MDPILTAILGAGLPILTQLIELGRLLISSNEKGLSLAEVQVEIDKIIKRSSSDTAEENAAAGIK